LALFSRSVSKPNTFSSPGPNKQFLPLAFQAQLRSVSPNFSKRKLFSIAQEKRFTDENFFQELIIKLFPFLETI
jgi:hypothetical protein